MTAHYYITFGVGFSEYVSGVYEYEGKLVLCDLTPLSLVRILRDPFEPGARARQKSDDTFARLSVTRKLHLLLGEEPPPI